MCRRPWRRCRDFSEKTVHGTLARFSMRTKSLENNYLNHICNKLDATPFTPKGPSVRSAAMRQRLLMLAAAAALSCAPSQARVEGPPIGRATARLSVSAEDTAPAEVEAGAGSHASAGYPHAHDHATHDHASDEAERAPASEDAERVAVQRVLTDEEIATKVLDDLGSLGSMSLGKPNAGALVNGVQMPAGERWEIVSDLRAWATQETIDYLVTAVDAVHEAHPGAHKLSIGHLSKEKGGRLYPHRSHQSGRDIDIGYYYVPEKAEWYRPATKQTLDFARSWALVKAFVVRTDVEMIFMDRSVQKMLKAYALSLGEDPTWLDSIFQYKSRHQEPIVRHTYGHKTHLHVRFYNPRAQTLGVRAYDALVKNKLIRPRNYLVPYKARGSDTLAGLAKKAGTSAATIQKVNGIGSLSPGQTLYVPMRGQVSHVAQVEIPARRLPPVNTHAQQTAGGRVVAGRSK